VTAQLMTATGVEGFVAALEMERAEPIVRGGLVVYTVTPLTGAWALRPVETGVATGEGSPWPATPAHWIHLPIEVRLAETNVQASPHPGWQAHSRDIGNWGLAGLPIRAWLAHVRGVLGGAV